MRLGLFTFISFILFFSASNSFAASPSTEKQHHFFAGARVGADLFKPSQESLGGGINLGLEAGRNWGKFGNTSLSVTTCSYDSNTQIFYYLFGYSHELIWNLSVSGFLGIQRYATETGAPLGSHASVSGFSYGLGLSYLFPNLYELGESATLQLIPEALYFKSSDLRWYGAAVNFRFNFLN
jgi:hypothetical protein